MPAHAGPAACNAATVGAEQHAPGRTSSARRCPGTRRARSPQRLLPDDGDIDDHERSGRHARSVSSWTRRSRSALIMKLGTINLACERDDADREQQPFEPPRHAGDVDRETRVRSQIRASAARSWSCSRCCSRCSSHWADSSSASATGTSTASTCRRRPMPARSPAAAHWSSRVRRHRRDRPENRHVAVDTQGRLSAACREHSPSYNPQVGGVPNSSVHAVLNGTAVVRRRRQPGARRENLDNCNGVGLRRRCVSTSRSPRTTRSRSPA